MEWFLLKSPTSNKVLTSRGRGSSDIFVAGTLTKEFLPINLNSYPFLFPADKNMEWEDVQKITEKLSSARKSNWDERTNRKELTQILSKEEEKDAHSCSILPTWKQFAYMTKCVTKMCNTGFSSLGNFSLNQKSYPFRAMN